MINYEDRLNVPSSYLKLWCETCGRTLKLINYGLQEVAPAGIALIDSMAIKHEQRNHRHKIYIFKGVRQPTNQEIREGR